MAARAQLPSQLEFEHAVEGARGEARALGLALRTDGLWLALLRSRTPLMAGVTPGHCHIGYTRYTPGHDYSWLFPALEPGERDLWLSALVQHELAHCVDDGPDRGARWREVYADLAFALHVDARAAEPGRLIERLAAIRERQAATDPNHDTAAALRCYLAHPDRGSDAFGLPWPELLAQWRVRCATH
jgi:hypothetical protein